VCVCVRRVQVADAAMKLLRSYARAAEENVGHHPRVGTEITDVQHHLCVYVCMCV
jgi:pterin-4a-carbinolamine dehydratase